MSGRGVVVEWSWSGRAVVVECSMTQIQTILLRKFTKSAPVAPKLRAINFIKDSVKKVNQIGPSSSQAQNGEFH